MSRIRSAMVEAADLFSDWDTADRIIGAAAVAVILLMFTGVI